MISEMNDLHLTAMSFFLKFNLYLVSYSEFFDFFFEGFAVSSDSVASDLGILGFFFTFYIFFFTCIARGFSGNFFQMGMETVGTR